MYLLVIQPGQPGNQGPAVRGGVTGMPLPSDCCMESPEWVGRFDWCIGTKHQTGSVCQQRVESIGVARPCAPMAVGGVHIGGGVDRLHVGFEHFVVGAVADGMRCKTYAALRSQLTVLQYLFSIQE